jgi:thioredoxin 1
MDVETKAMAEPTRGEIDALIGPVLLEFGAVWCGFCRAAQPLVTAAKNDHPHIRHIKIEDGSGRPLGRTFGVKLWPTLIFMRDGQEVTRIVRPHELRVIQEALTRIV